LRSFWANKAAVAATFIIVSIIAIVFVFTTTTFALRRRKQRLAENDILTEKYPESAAHDDLSTHDVILPASGDAYPDRQVHYGTDNDKLYPVTAPNQQRTYGDQQLQQVSYPAVNYSMGYPPGTAYAPDIPTKYETQASYYYQSASRSAQSPTPPKLPPIQQQGTSFPPSAYRDFGGRRESWQQSIDSFYGASGAR
jgi:hypothetical protein